MNKYKEGDKVLMGPKKWQEQRASLVSAVFPDQVVEITDALPENRYEVWLSETSGDYAHESQILGHAFEYGDEIEVRNTERNGEPVLFGATCQQIAAHFMFAKTQKETPGSGKMPAPSPNPKRRRWTH